MGHDLRALYGGAYRRLVGQVYALTQDRAAAEQWVQDAFVRAASAGRWFGRHDDPESRIRAVALRSARRRRKPAEESDDGELSPSESAIAVLKALRELPAHDRDVAALGIFAGVPSAEIASVVGSSPTKVDARLTRSRRRLTAGDYGIPLTAALHEARVWIEQSADPPPFDTLLAAGRHRRRRTGAWGVAAVAAVLAAGVTVPIVVRDVQPGPLVSVSQIKFVDRNNGYALVQPCHKGKCTLQIARTADAGRHWSSINIPHGPLTGMTNGIALAVCCGNRVSVTYSRLASSSERAQHLAASDGTIRIRAVSDNAGKHWTSGPDHSDGLKVGPATHTVPAGWTPITDYGMSQPQVVAMNSVDEVERPLSHQPGLANPDVSVPFQQGGRIWAVGGSRRDQLAYSDDNGNSWQPTNAPKMADGQAISAVFPRPGNSLYVQTRTAGGQKTGPTYRLDAAQRWTKLPAFGLSQDAVAGTVLPNGELWISNAKYQTWRTTDGGTHVQSSPGPKLDGADVRLALAGVTPDGTIYALEPPGGRQNVVLTSTDNGQHWNARDIRLPRPKH
jgi:RNA polymerase sigma-70 factor (ECF subfamily)